jgi:3-hydroxybutyryl-CoA dehydratase
MMFENFYLGQTAKIKRTFFLKDVQKFSELSGDINPIHLDNNFAEQTIFKKPIVHGFLYSSLISALLANDLPGPGSIYIYQELNFKSPVYHGEEVTAIVKIVDLRSDKNILTLETICTVRDNVEVLTGKAIIKLI